MLQSSQEKLLGGKENIPDEDEKGPIRGYKILVLLADVQYHIQYPMN